MESIQNERILRILKSLQHKGCLQYEIEGRKVKVFLNDHRFAEMLKQKLGSLPRQEPANIR